MGIKIFYLAASLYTLAAGAGFLPALVKLSPGGFGGWLGYAGLGVIGLSLILFTLKRKTGLAAGIVAGVAVNFCVQSSGGMASPLFLYYFALIFLIAYREVPRDYWLIAGMLAAAEISSAFFRHAFDPLSAAGLVIAGIIAGLVNRKWLARETAVKRALTKYETRDQFFNPADFEARTIVTSVKDIDRHPGIERPLLYLVKYLHNSFNAYTTAIFSYYNNSLVLIQGFSRSELFKPDAVIELKSGLYRQIIAEQKSVLIKEFTQDPAELGVYKGELKIASAIIAPIMLLDKVEGVLVVDRKEGAFTDEEKTMFDEASRSVGFMLAMLKLYEKERYEARYLSSIAELAKSLQRGLELKVILADTVKALKSILKCDDISFASIDELNESGVVLESTYIKVDTDFSFEDGLVGLVGRHKNYILKDDLSGGSLTVLKKGVRSNTGSFVGVPVKENDEILGVVWLEDHRRNKFNEDDVRALNILASQLTLAWQRALLHERVKEQSIRDGLTGLYNHRYFQDVLEKELARQKELILILFDIDHFKKVNDAHGHQAGDEVLMFLGRLVSQTGIAARYGGEEFAVIIPGANLEKGVKIAVKLKDHLKKAEVKYNQIKIKITVSIGVAHFPKDAATRVELIEKADRSLYQAKKTGRDKIVVARSLDTTA